MDARPNLSSTWHTAGFLGARSVNADAVASHPDAVTGGLVVALADGVGDTPAAATAALLAATAAVTVPVAAGPAAALAAAQVAVRADPSAGDCVLVVAQPFGLGYRIAWVGDVRAYSWDGWALRLLTTDHTVAQYFRDRGAAVSPVMEHQVLTSVRTAPPARFGLASLSIPSRLLLTSDGVHKPVAHPTMTEIMRYAPNPATALVEAARAAGGTDNATAVVVDNTFLPPTGPQPVLPAAA